MVAALPESQPYVEPLTEEYVRFRFARQAASAGEVGPTSDDAALLQTWQTVEPIFWKAWLRNLRDRLLHRRPRKDLYTLVDKEPDA